MCGGDRGFEGDGHGCGVAGLVTEILSDRLHVRDGWIKSEMVAMWKWWYIQG